jgi:exportin-T
MVRSWSYVLPCACCCTPANAHATQVLQEIANFLQIVCKTRGQEAVDFFVNVFLPAQGWPAPTAVEFTTKLRDLDAKAFRRYFADMVRASRA